MNTVLAQELINDNGISVIAVAFFTGLFGFLGILAKGVLDLKKQNREAASAATTASDKADIAATSAQEAAQNTRGVSNGFVGRVDQKLNRILERQDDIESSFRKHLETHINNTK